MTAIKEFERLEALGLWKENEHSQRREVIVSFGDSTLVLSDTNSSPLAHWSLAAISGTQTGENGTVYMVDTQGRETLEIEDPLMISAIAKIRLAIEMSRPHPGRLRWILGFLVVMAFLGFSLFWMPNAVTRYAANILPDAKANEIGDDLIASITRTTGSTCSNPSGERALRRLEARVIGAPSNRIVILKMGSRPSLHLPGGNILLNHSLVREHDGPQVLAGYALLERADEDEQSAAVDLFQTIGLRETIHFLANGEISDKALELFADKRLFGPYVEPNDTNLIDLFEVANIQHRYFSHVSNNPELAAIPDIPADQTDPILSDADWVALQEICSG